MWNKEAVSNFFASKRSQQGLSLIETLISIALISIVAVVYLQSLLTSTKVTTLIHHRNVAESLARSQMEFIKGQSFSGTPAWDYWVNSSGKGSDGQPPSWWVMDLQNPNPPLLQEIYGDYLVECSAEDISIDIDDDGVINVRKITVEVSNPDVDDSVLILEGHKIDR